MDPDLQPYPRLVFRSRVSTMSKIWNTSFVPGDHLFVEIHHEVTTRRQPNTGQECVLKKTVKIHDENHEVLGAARLNATDAVLPALANA